MKNKSAVVKSIYNDPKYSGKHVVAIAGRVFSAKTGNEAAKIFARETAKHPNDVPLATYIPDDSVLVL